MLKLRGAEITRLTRELVQEGVSYEELRQANEEKDAAILDLQQAAETTRAALEKEKKQVEGMLLFPLFAYWLNSLGSAPNLICVFAFRPADGSRDDDDPSRGDPDKSSQRELEDLQGAALEVCQSVEEGNAQAGSSMTSHLCAFGGHVTRRMQRALRLGVQKTLGAWWCHTTGSILERCPRAVSFLRVSTMTVLRSR
jgi:hypothetical protein